MNGLRKRKVQAVLIQEVTMNKSDLSDPSSLVSCNALYKQYGEVNALNGLNLEVPFNAFCLLVGPNGSGKTTTIKILLDLVFPDSGEVSVFGRNPKHEGAIIRSQTGFVPEHQCIGYPWMTVEYLLSYHSAYYPSWNHEYADKLSKVLGVRKQAKLCDLSKGERRQVDLITALSHTPPLLLLDEPLVGLDPLVRKVVTGVFAEHLSQHPTTVLVSTHHVEDLNALASHLIVISRGKLLGHGSRSDLNRYLRSYRMQISNSSYQEDGLGAAVLKKQGTDGDVVWTIWGEEEFILERLQHAGATVRETIQHSLEEAAVLLLDCGSAEL